MRISEYYELGQSQETLDFVDVDVAKDAAIFVDPHALRGLDDDWGQECVSLLQSFFSTVIESIAGGDHPHAHDLLATLREPNETHLGVSRDMSRGRALGDSSSTDIADALAQSEAAKSGLLTDLEDAALMVPRISDDIISDVATNIIRGPLIRYTQEQCEFYGIGTELVASGPTWDANERAWQHRHHQQPVAEHKRLLFVPKTIVRIKPGYQVDEYYSKYLLAHLQDVHLSANSALVEVLRNGRRRVTKKALKKHYGTGKAAVVSLTREYPSVLERYRRDKERQPSRPLEQEEVAESLESGGPDWDALLHKVIELPVGAQAADAYERAIEALLTALFYPSLAHPARQFKIHNGRKRIDIAYSNVAELGFFRWLSLNYPAAKIFVECKNYADDPANPELDQLVHRM